MLNKSENERSGVLSTAMSFLGLYRDPTVAAVTSRCDWRIADLVSAEHPLSLYLVVPPSDISRTKPLIRLILNQIGRRLTESLDSQDGEKRKHRVLFMLDEFPALGRLDFFESALAFMAGYGLRSFLIAQSLNQIEKAYGPNNSILDNCHVRIAFASNDERTAKRISDALGTATELRAQRNYAGHRLSPWLGHLMVSAPGDRAAAPHAGRGDAAPAGGRDRHDLGRAAGPRQEAALLRGRELQEPRPARAEAKRGRLRRPAGAPRRRLVGRLRSSGGRRRPAPSRAPRCRRGRNAPPARTRHDAAPGSSCQEEDEKRPDLVLLDDDDDGEAWMSSALAACARSTSRQLEPCTARNAALDPDDGIAL